MTYDFPPPDYGPWLGLWINCLIMLPIFLWGAGLFRRKQEGYDTKPKKRTRWISAILLSLAGLSFLPFFLILPFAIGGRLIDRKRENPLPLLFLGTLPMFLYCLSNWYMFAGAGEAASRSSCRKNLKTLSEAFGDYHETEGHFPPATFQSPEDQQVSWRVEFAERLNALPSPYDRSLRWDAPANTPLLKQKPDYFSCPTHARNGTEDGQRHTSYALVTGEGTLYSSSGPLSKEEITDGLSNTILMGEAAGLQIPWTEPRDINIDQQPLGINLPGAQPHQSPGSFSSYHCGGGFFMMTDGSVQWFGKNIDPKILRALVTPSGGEDASLGEIID
ncbi:MAG: DUF1559 domain-containing protein [Planctomycetaceae bacterium]|nr:DUF1559 domain-containing protein [Planctomycetaceae bacterium]